MIITKNNIRNLVENISLEILNEEDPPTEETPAEKESAEKYPFMKDFLRTGDVSILKKNKQEVFNLIGELVNGIDMSLSELADIEKRNKKEQEKREREQRLSPGQPSPGQASTEQEPKLGDAINDKGEEIKPGEEETIELGDEDIEHLVDKDAPLSVMRKQKNIKGEDSKPEEPIVGKLEKMIPGLGQSGAQFLAKSIASYLKKRGLPVAESNILSTASLLLTEAQLPKKPHFRPEQVGPAATAAMKKEVEDEWKQYQSDLKKAIPTIRGAQERSEQVPEIPDAGSPAGSTDTDVPELGGPQSLGTLKQDLKTQKRSKFLDPKPDDTKPSAVAPEPAADDKEPSAAAPETNSNLSSAEKQARSGRVKSFTAGIRRNLSKNLADDPKKQKKFLYKVINLSKQGREGLEQLNQNLGSQLNDEEIASASASLQKWSSNALSTWGKEGHVSGDSFRDLQANMQTNIKNIKAAAKDMDPLGKVIARSLTSNYGNAAKNPGLAKLLSDPKGIARISVSIKHFLQKQLQLRGKDTADIKNLMEQLTIVMDSLLKEGVWDINPGDTVKFRSGAVPSEMWRAVTGEVASIDGRNVDVVWNRREHPGMLGGKRINRMVDMSSLLKVRK